jgi:hypothetical protein
MNNFELKFYEIPLKAHDFLEGVPMHSLDFIELKGGDKGMLMDEIYRLTTLNQAEEMKFGLVTKTLFWLRGVIGKIMGWDDVPEMVKKNSWISKLSKEEQEKSLIPSGKVESINTILYCFDHEILFEIINRTVHCFWVITSVEKADGYDLYIAVYVKKINWRTPIYMALISPVLKWIIYPAVGKGIKQNWEKNFPPKNASPQLPVRV